MLVTKLNSKQELSHYPHYQRAYGQCQTAVRNCHWTRATREIPQRRPTATATGLGGSPTGEVSHKSGTRTKSSFQSAAKQTGSISFHLHLAPLQHCVHYSTNWSQSPPFNALLALLQSKGHPNKRTSSLKFLSLFTSVMFNIPPDSGPNTGNLALWSQPFCTSPESPPPPPPHFKTHHFSCR